MNAFAMAASIVVIGRAFVIHQMKKGPRMANKYKGMSQVAAYRRWRACDRKVAYNTEEEAFQKGQAVYRCRYCGKFHRSGSLATLVAVVGRHHEN